MVRGALRGAAAIAAAALFGGVGLRAGVAQPGLVVDPWESLADLPASPGQGSPLEKRGPASTADTADARGVDDGGFEPVAPAPARSAADAPSAASPGLNVESVAIVDPWRETSPPSAVEVGSGDWLLAERAPQLWAEIIDPWR